MYTTVDILIFRTENEAKQAVTSLGYSPAGRKMLAGPISAKGANWINRADGDQSAGAFDKTFPNDVWIIVVGG
jgi:hypothetical protein